MEIKNLHQLIERSKRRFNKKKFIHEKFNSNFESHSFLSFYNDVKVCAKFLLTHKLKNKKIAIVGKNSYRWLVVHLSIMSYVGVSIPLDYEWKERDYQNIFKKIKLSAIFCDNDLLPFFKKITRKYPNISIFPLQKEIVDNKIKKKISPRNPNSMCQIIFTSGTTSNPKAIMLSQTNLLANHYDFYKIAPMSNNDRAYLILPIHHIYGSLCVCGTALYTGTQVYFGTNVKEISSDIQEIKPTIIPGVPLFYEKIFKRINLNNKFFVNLSIKISNFFLYCGIDFRPYIFKKIHKNLGGNIKYLFSCSAPLDENIALFFYNIGLPIQNTYGLTECSGIVSMNSKDNNQINSVGKVYSNQKIKISTDKNNLGEILIKGPNVMLGYYKNTKLTKHTIDDDGYIHTGDIGYLDNKKYLHITGRKKRIIITNNGRNIDPLEIEELFLSSKYIIKTQVYEKNNHLYIKIYTKYPEEIINQLFIEVNSSLPKYKRLTSFEIINPTKFTQMRLK